MSEASDTRVEKRRRSPWYTGWKDGRFPVGTVLMRCKRRMGGWAHYAVVISPTHIAHMHHGKTWWAKMPLPLRIPMNVLGTHVCITRGDSDLERHPYRVAFAAPDTEEERQQVLRRLEILAERGSTMFRFWGANNCEALANWLRFGYWASEQGEYLGRGIVEAAVDILQQRRPVEDVVDDFCRLMSEGAPKEVRCGRPGTGLLAPLPSSKREASSE